MSYAQGGNMDYIQNLQMAINYMEEHLFEPITYTDVAKHIFMSNYHFHKTFSLITGMTANEYIRNRRLSLAGQELTLSDLKIIDIALKYGYESPESFTKAFVRFHGVTPIVARRSGMKLKSFNRLVVMITVKGGDVMDYRIEKREKFRLLVKIKKFRNEITLEEGNTEILDFWKECSNNGTFGILRESTGKHDFYGPCSPMSDKDDYFDYGIGMVYENGIVPEGFTIWEVNPTLWAVFKCNDETDACIRETWKKIYTEFLPGSEYRLLEDTDFEFLAEDSTSCEIWIPVEKRDIISE
jgi:AraC family transcriptional regulator